MEKIATSLPDVWILEPKVFGDYRGYFMETYNRETFASRGIPNDGERAHQSFAHRQGNLRGIHFQMDPMAQCKIVRVTRGAVKDLAVDLRKGSPTYKKWVLVELSAENKRMLYIPRGFGHGFVTLTDDVEFVYKVDNLYSKECDRSIRYDDPEIGVDWEIENPIRSEKDLAAPFLKDSDVNFIYGK